MPKLFVGHGTCVVLRLTVPGSGAGRSFHAGAPTRLSGATPPRPSRSRGSSHLSDEAGRRLAHRRLPVQLDRTPLGGEPPGPETRHERGRNDDAVQVLALSSGRRLHELASRGVLRRVRACPAPACASCSPIAIAQRTVQGFEGRSAGRGSRLRSPRRGRWAATRRSWVPTGTAIAARPGAFRARTVAAIGDRKWASRPLEPALVRAHSRGAGQ